MKAGSIVKHFYKTFDGESRIGLFLIIYDEKYDCSIVANDNLLGLKITSTSRDLHYDVELKKANNPCLDHTSYVMCSKPLVMSIRNLEVIGEVCPFDMLSVFSSYRRFQSQIEIQLTDLISKALIRKEAI